MNTSEAAVNELHFHPKWFEFGFLDSGFFEHQLNLFRGSSDSFWSSPEHHRYCGFAAILAAKNQLSDAEMWQYVELCQMDEDAGMGLSALLNLLQWPGLTLAQFDLLATHPACSNSTAQKIVKRIRLRSALSHRTLTNEIVVEVLDSRDFILQRELVETPNISRPQLELLAEQGASRAVRNMTKNRLRRRA